MYRGKGTTHAPDERSMETLQVRQARSFPSRTLIAGGAGYSRWQRWDSGDMERRRGRAELVRGHRVWPDMGEDGEGRHESERRIDGVAVGVGRAPGFSAAGDQ